MDPSPGIDGIQRLFPRFVFSSKKLTELIFGIEVTPYQHPSCQNWDLTTLAFKRALDNHISDGQKILEIGTGPLAILSIYLARRKAVHITAVDINPAFIESARRNAGLNKANIELKQSDLFANVDGIFDVILFNPPYVPTQWVLGNRRRMHSNSIFDMVCDGGIDGCDTIGRFLKEVASVMHQDSVVLLGVNTSFVSIKRIGELVKRNDLLLTSVVGSWGNPSRIYIIANRIH